MKKQLLLLSLTCVTVHSNFGLTYNEALEQTQRWTRYLFAYEEQSSDEKESIKSCERQVATGLQQVASSVASYDKTIKDGIEQWIREKAQKIAKSGNEHEGNQVAISNALINWAKLQGTEYGSLRSFTHYGIEKRTRQLMREHNTKCVNCSANNPSVHLSCGHTLCTGCQWIYNCPKCSAKVERIKPLECGVTMCDGKGGIQQLPNCPHAIHYSCYNSWKKSCSDRNVAFTCPQCRSNINGSINNFANPPGGMPITPSAPPYNPSNNNNQRGTFSAILTLIFG